MTARRFLSWSLYATAAAALYLGAGITVREWTRARLAQSEAIAEARWVGRRLDWTFVDAQGRTYALGAPNLRRRIVLVGVDGCPPCTAQQREVVRLLSAMSATPRDVEVWVASTKAVFIEGMSDTGVPVIPMRHISIDFKLPGAVALPMMMEVDIGGIVRRVSLGFVDGRSSRALTLALNPNPQEQR